MWFDLIWFDLIWLQLADLLAYLRKSDHCRVTVKVRVADCCIQTAGDSAKMRISHVIKIDQWRSVPLRILSCPVIDVLTRAWRCRNWMNYTGICAEHRMRRMRRSPQRCWTRFVEWRPCRRLGRLLAPASKRSLHSAFSCTQRYMTVHNSWCPLLALLALRMWAPVRPKQNVDRWRPKFS